AVVAFLAMMPWLAITLVGSCILASVRRLRFQFRYASALLGLVLVIIYFIFASQQVAAPVASLENPADRIKFIAPWILAAVASCALMAFVLFIAAMVNYRPGAIAPLLALMFVIPVALFEFNVGRDELHYRLLEHDYATHFAETDLAARYEQTVQAAWLARSPPRPPREQIEDSIELAWQLRLDEVVSPRVAQHCYEVVQRADRFVRRYPDSRYAVAAVYLKAQALDMRVDQGAFLKNRVLRFYSSFPSQASEPAWRRVVHNAPRSPMTAVALLRLAVLEARAGRMDEARAHLRQVIDAFGADADEAPDDEAASDQVLTVKPVEQTLDISLDRTLLEARRLSELLEKNRDPLYGYQPIVDLLHFDPRGEHHRSNLQGLLDHYPPGAEPQIADNVELAIALTVAEPAERLERLEACARRHPDGDAQAETLFRLGQAYRQTGDSARARTHYEQLLREHADAIWRNPAQQALRVLPSPAPSAPIPD
ncbi:MAG: tetratricopeptide repeat protein, partial [Planctomycetes bacterium]|nr:tetratricopeptide repeat protein [Planctomycetota bacterium]